MAGEPVISDVLRRLGIEARLRGREWTARCPNPEHDDRNPSWRVHDEPGWIKHGLNVCHSCGFGGNLADLVAAVLRVSQREARAWLEGGEVAVGNPPGEVELRVLWSGAAFDPPPFSTGDLDAWPSQARAYVLGRGITSEQVGRWGIGYAVEGRLAGRIVFPKRDRRGALSGYSARTYVDDRTRYLTPHPAERPNQAVMFGESGWPVASGPTLYVFEGAINALAVERALGAPVPIATLEGSQLHPMHALKLSGWKDQVHVTDHDAAGDKAAGQLSAAMRRHGVRVRRAILPARQDAASVPASVLREAVTCC